MEKVLRLAALAAVSPAGALIGGMLDERDHLGFTNWRSACRSSGISLASLANFTLELLPTAVIGALSGALLVQALAFALRHDPARAGQCLAAHLGCALAMPFGLLLCALALPVSLMLLVEIALAVLAALLLQRSWKRHSLTAELSHP